MVINVYVQWEKSLYINTSQKVYDSNKPYHEHNAKINVTVIL